MDRYTKGVVLGVGTFGKVLMATDKEVRVQTALCLFSPLAGGGAAWHEARPST